MESLRQVGSGLLFGLVCLAIVVGGFALSMAEGGMDAIVAPSLTLTPGTPATSVPAISPTLPLIPATDTPVSSPTFTFTPPPPPTNCLPPAGWVAVVVQMHDTLSGLAQTYRVSVDSIRQSNCLVSDQLVPGSFIYVPPLPTVTPIRCGAPAGWVNYIVQPGDTLFLLSQKFRVSVSAIQIANCLGDSTNIRGGQVIKVPNVPTSTPLNSATPSITVIVIKEETPTPTLKPSATLPTSTTEAPPPTTEVPSRTPVPPSDTPPPTAAATPTATP